MICLPDLRTKCSASEGARFPCENHHTPENTSSGAISGLQFIISQATATDSAKLALDTLPKKSTKLLQQRAATTLELKTSFIQELFERKRDSPGQNP